VKRSAARRLRIDLHAADRIDRANVLIYRRVVMGMIVMMIMFVSVVP
jgi:hypothetical protein